MNRISRYSRPARRVKNKIACYNFLQNQRTKLSPQKSQSNQQPTTEIAWTTSSTFLQRETLCVTYTLFFRILFLSSLLSHQRVNINYLNE